jgi:ABC-type transport system substrate-binding protein
MDVAKRTAIAQELQRIAAEDAVAVPLYVAERFTVFDKTLSDNFYYTRGGGPLYPGILNKLIFTSSKRSGF